MTRQRWWTVAKTASEPTISVAFQPVTVTDVANDLRAEARILSDYAYGVENAAVNELLRESAFRLLTRASMLDELADAIKRQRTLPTHETKSGESPR
jgi:hypothetical protein